MTTMIKSHLDKPVESLRDLIAYLEGGARPPERWGVGTEMEKLVLDAETGEAASYDRIAALLRRLEGTGRWRGVHEGGNLIALMGENSSVTLEPGGQLELSGELCSDLHCSKGGFFRHVREVVPEASSMGLLFLGLGIQPFTSLDRIDLLPKSRYGIMAPYMARSGDMGQRMMKQSAGLQVNLDFSDESDCVDKLRVSLAVSPLLYALFANSPIMEERPSGFLSTRGEIWSRTDPQRTGLLPQLFEDGAGFHTYVDYALDVPMYFISREGRYVDLTRETFTFRRYLAEGFEGYSATLADWDLHLSTLFPEVRLRPQIEVRSPDSLPQDLTMAPAALVKGLLYDETARRETWNLLGSQSPEQREILYRQSWHLGLRTPFGRHTLREAALEVLEIARDSLVRQGKKLPGGEDESIYLEGAYEIAQSGVTLAERLLQQWRGSRRDKLAILKVHCGFK